MYGTITVVNRKFLPERTPNTFRIKIDRPSPLGCPFIIGRDGNRKTVIEKYRKYITGKLKHSTPDDPIIREIIRIYQAWRRGQDVELVCNCKPKPCHGDVIKEIVENMRGGK